MATFYLINSILVGTEQRFAGEFIDDSQTNTALLKSAGGVLWPSSDPVIATAAANCQLLKLRGEARLIDSIMQAALAQLQFTKNTYSILARGTATLALGTATVSGLGVIPTGAVPVVTLVTPGGTMGAKVKAVLTTGSNGSLTITATDTSGATVTTDTSTYAYAIEG